MKRSIKKVFLLGAMSMGLIVVLNSCSENERESGNLGGSLEVKSPENENFDVTSNTTSEIEMIVGPRIGVEASAQAQNIGSQVGF